MIDALVALGSNMPSDQGDPAATLDVAVAQIAAVPGLTVMRKSKWYRTPAFPPGSGPDFVNGAAIAATDLPPTEILAVLHQIEAKLGRTRDKRWEPRICDLDLIGVGDRVSPNQDTLRHWMSLDTATAAAERPGGLILPHPRMHERGFVLVPLADIAPNWVHPVLGKRVRDLVGELPIDDLDRIRPL